jgi:hypothetical protein
MAGSASPEFKFRQGRTTSDDLRGFAGARPGRPPGQNGFMLTDITERRLAEEARRRARLQKRTSWNVQPRVVDRELRMIPSEVNGLDMSAGRPPQFHWNPRRHRQEPMTRFSIRSRWRVLLLAGLLPVLVWLAAHFVLGMPLSRERFMKGSGSPAPPSP